MELKNYHYYDGAGICMKCDSCKDPLCCEQTEECFGTNWNFLTNGTLERISLEIMERRKNGE